MKKQLWAKAFDALHARYGNPAPIEITNRLLTEQADMQNTDRIVFLDLLSLLASKAQKHGEHIRVGGSIGSSFTAYLLGATEINPLKPHYYCPKCRTVLFDNSTHDGWDLRGKVCSCGYTMHADGHNIPLEAFRPFDQRNTGFVISVSPEYISSAISVIQEYFTDCTLTNRELGTIKIIACSVSTDEGERSIALCADEEFSRYKKLERATATCFERVPFISGEMLKEFREFHTEGIIEFGGGFMKNVLCSISPQSFHDLVQIMGLTHGTGVWYDNGDKLIEAGHSTAQVIAYREDVFNYVQGKMLARGMTDTGFAYKVMQDTRQGIYAKNGLPDDIRLQLKAIDGEDWFVDSISKIRFLFQKAHGVALVKLAATLMWYKLHFPKEFREIML